uniref:Chromo domain-containing protein n=1 Tax=Meloidogyne incognita TaxID=6306 RepID=A0A914N3A2_MELIC
MLNLRPPSNKGFVTPPPRLPTPPPIIEGEYEVEAILTSRIVQNLRTGFRNRQFLIKWKGFTYQEMTWEDENNLSDCEDLKLKWFNLHIEGTTPVHEIMSSTELPSPPRNKYNGWTDAELSDEEHDPEWCPITQKQKRQRVKFDMEIVQPGPSNAESSSLIESSEGNQQKLLLTPNLSKIVTRKPSIEIDLMENSVPILPQNCTTPLCLNQTIKKRKKHGGRDLCGAERKRRRREKLLGHENNE